jgi:hypothetical protein
LLMYGLKPIQLARWKIHCLCLGVPLVLALAMLGTNTYGVSAGGSGAQVCSYGGNLYYGNIIHAVIYDGFLLLNFLLMIIFLIQLYLMSRNNPILARSPAFVIVMRALCFYPIALIVCWFPHVILQLVNFSLTDPKRAGVVDPVFDAVKILHGGVATIIFFHHSNEARSRWWNLVQGWVDKVHCFPWLCAADGKNSGGKGNNLLPSSLTVSEYSEELGMNGTFRSSSQLLNDKLVDNTTFSEPPPATTAVAAPSAPGSTRKSRGSVNTNTHHHLFVTDKIAQSIRQGTSSGGTSAHETPQHSCDIRANSANTPQSAGSHATSKTGSVAVDTGLADWPQDSVLIQLFAQVALENNLQATTPFGVTTPRTNSYYYNSGFASSSSAASSLTSSTSQTQNPHGSSGGHRSKTPTSGSSSPYPPPAVSPLQRSTDTHSTLASPAETSDSSGSHPPTTRPRVYSAASSGLVSIISNLSSLFRSTRSGTHASHSNVSTLSTNSEQSGSKLQSQVSAKFERTTTETELTARK